MEPAINTAPAITAHQVDEKNRTRAVQRHAGPHVFYFETMIYAYLDGLCSDYDGGYWELYELSNGGFYMTPPDTVSYEIRCPGNYYDGTVSADTAGIIACLFAYGALWERTRDDRFIELIGLLKDFAAEHPDAAEIFSAID